MSLMKVVGIEMVRVVVYVDNHPLLGYDHRKLYGMASTPNKVQKYNVQCQNRVQGAALSMSTILKNKKYTAMSFIPAPTCMSSLWF